MVSRAKLHAAAKSTPLEAVLGPTVTKALTPKQRAFAKGIAEGKTKASAYRDAYKQDASPHTLSSKPYHLARDDRIRAEVEAYALAIESAKQRTPAALRELVIHGLVQVALNPDTKDAVKVQALKTLGTVTEVAAFTERKEVRTITSSEDARRAVMTQIHQLMGAQVEDANVIGGEADELMRELAGTHPPGTPPVAEPESPSDIHTVPHKVSANFVDADPPANFCNDSASTPPPQSGETPR